MKKLLLILIIITSCSIDNNESREELNPEDYTPRKVVEYLQAPGFYSNHSDFKIDSNIHKLLGFPIGGGSKGPDNSSIVTLGEAGGYVVLEFDPPIKNGESFDFIVFGNSFFKNGDSAYPNIEFGIVEVMEDSNGNSLPDDDWYVLIHPVNRGLISKKNKLYNKANYSDEHWTFSESSKEVSVWEIEGDVVYKGFADCNPTLASEDNKLYTIPDTPLEDLDSGSGGGDSLDIDWAISSSTLEQVKLKEISWIKISTASYPSKDSDDVRFRFSTEVDGVVRVER